MSVQNTRKHPCFLTLLRTSFVLLGFGAQTNNHPSIRKQEEFMEDTEKEGAGKGNHGLSFIRHPCIACSDDVGAVREPPVYRDMEQRTDMITQQQDLVLGCRSGRVVGRRVIGGWVVGRCVVGLFRVFFFIEEDAHGGRIEVIELSIFGGPDEDPDGEGRKQ